MYMSVLLFFASYVQKVPFLLTQPVRYMLTMRAHAKVFFLVVPLFVNNEEYSIYIIIIIVIL